MTVKFQGAGLLRGLMSLVFEVGNIVLVRSLHFRVLFGHIQKQLA